MTLFFSLFVQLIDDKKALSERCEGVVGELKLVDQKYTKKIGQMQEQHELVRGDTHTSYSTDICHPLSWPLGCRLEPSTTMA